MTSAVAAVKKNTVFSCSWTSKVQRWTNISHSLRWPHKTMEGRGRALLGDSIRQMNPEDESEGWEAPVTQCRAQLGSLTHSVSPSAEVTGHLACRKQQLVAWPHAHWTLPPLHPWAQDCPEGTADLGGRWEADLLHCSGVFQSSLRQEESETVTLHLPCPGWSPWVLLHCVGHTGGMVTWNRQWGYASSAIFAYLRRGDLI